LAEDCPIGMRSHISHASTSNDWTKPAAKAIPKEGYFTLEQGRYGPTYPRTPACHGFTIIAKIKAGTEPEIRAYGKRIEDTIASSPQALAPLQLHYLRWVLFNIGPDTYFMYQGIFDTDFDRYIRLLKPAIASSIRSCGCHRKAHARETFCSRTQPCSVRCLAPTTA